MEALRNLLAKLLGGEAQASGPREGYAFIPGSQIQARIGSDLLRGPGYNEPMGQPGFPGNPPVLPPSSPTPQPSITSEYQQLTPVPRAQGYPEVPENIRDILFQVFQDSFEATPAAQVLTHPSQTTHIGGEIPRPKNTGENPRFDIQAENKNKDGSIDRGLFQINSNTFSDFQQRQPEILQRAGITSWDDMFDPLLNAKMADIIAKEQGWRAWYGAPRNLRKREYGGGE